MKMFWSVLAVVVTLSLTTFTQAADNKKLIVGKWEAVKADEGSLPKGSIVEFKADGKISITAKKEGKDSTIDGTYTVDGDAFMVTLKPEGKEISFKIKIKKLSETELDTANEQDKSVSFKRLK